MTKDRIDQLRSGNVKYSKRRKPSQSNGQKEENEEDETTALTGEQVQPVIVKTKSKENNELKNVFKHVNIINELIGVIQEDVVQLKWFHVRMQQASRTDPNMRDQVDSLSENIKANAIKIKSSLKDLEMEKKGDDERVINRVVKTQHSLLSKRFRETMEDFENSLLAHKNFCEELIKMQLKLVIEGVLIRKITCVPVDKEVSDEELCTILDAQDTAIFVDNYTKETLEARQSLEDARDRHKEILKIEKDIELIREMFFKLALHVTEQGELIDRIEYHIGNGYVMTQKGNKKLSKAEKLMQSAREKKCWIIICLLAVVAVLILVIVLQIAITPG